MLRWLLGLPDNMSREPETAPETLIPGHPATFIFPYTINVNVIVSSLPTHYISFFYGQPTGRRTTPILIPNQCPAIPTDVHTYLAAMDLRPAIQVPLLLPILSTPKRK